MQASFFNPCVFVSRVGEEELSSPPPLPFEKKYAFSWSALECFWRVERSFLSPSFSIVSRGMTFFLGLFDGVSFFLSRENLPYLFSSTS